MMDSSPFVLTFGVELEFIACYNPADYENKLKLLDGEGKLWRKEYNLSLQQKYRLLVRNHMIEILNKHGFPTNEFNRGYVSNNYSKWSVETDTSVSSIDTVGNWHAVELKTPALRSGKASLDLIDRAVKLLVSKFRIYTNESCGLHVHVGNENRGFDLRTLKNFCSLITSFDRQLESLHHPSRVENPFARSPRKILTHGIPRTGTLGNGTWGELSLAEKLSIIDKMEELEELLVQFRLTKANGKDDKYMAYNFNNLSDERESLQTIEFRQHRGTLDPELITQWVTVVCSLVENSYRDEGSFHRLFDEVHANDSTYTVVDLLEDLQLREQAEFYAPLVHQYGADRNPAAAYFMVGEEPALTNTSFPGQYDTLWEKEFAPRPPCELTSFCRIKLH